MKNTKTLLESIRKKRLSERQDLMGELKKLKSEADREVKKLKDHAKWLNDIGGTVDKDYKKLEPVAKAGNDIAIRDFRESVLDELKRTNELIEDARFRFQTRYT